MFRVVLSSGGAPIENNLYDFQGGNADGATPMAALTVVPSTFSNEHIIFYRTTLNGGANNNGTVFKIDIPPPPSSPGYSAQCDINCFENSLKWRLPPPRWVLGVDSIGFEGSVQQVTNGGKTVEFKITELNTLRGFGQDRTAGNDAHLRAQRSI